MTRSKVLIAGGGIAGLEALLALNETARDRVHIEMIAPDPSFRLRPLSVAAPFNHAQPRELDLAETCLALGASFARDSLTGVETGLAITASGRRIPFDFLIVAIGAREGVTLPGAVAYWDSADQGAFEETLRDLESGALGSLAFAVPSGVTWSLGLYELALLTAHRLHGIGLSGPPVHLVTPEEAPLEIFGSDASSMAGELLRKAGVKLATGATPVEWRDGELVLNGAPPLACDRVVSLPVGSTPRIDGLEQDENGFLRVDEFGAVEGHPGVYAAGDAASHPIKQGGLATQLADSAASAIAVRAGADVARVPFRPILRGALLTPWGPRFMRRGSDRSGLVSKSPMWWPPSKVAGRYLTPFLAAEAGYDTGSQSLEERPAAGGDPTEATAERDDVVSFALSLADADADAREFHRALRWLEVVEDLELFLPAGYETKRAAWRALAHEQR